MRKSIISTFALASLASVALLQATAPAAAARKSCLQKAQSCEQRCAGRYSDWVPCISRTCNPQYDNCVAGGRRAGLVATPVQPGGGAAAGTKSPKTDGKPAPKGPVIAGSTGSNGGGKPVSKPIRR
jgi:hypothetical protein